MHVGLLLAGPLCYSDWCRSQRSPFPSIKFQITPRFRLFIEEFYILLTVHLVMILGKWPTWRVILFYVFISILYMSRATSCSFSWWWARGCSRNVENWNKYIEKNWASSWPFTKNQFSLKVTQPSHVIMFFRQLPRNQLLTRYVVTSPVHTVTIRCYVTR